MTHTKRTNSLYNYLVIFLILLAVAIRGGASFDWLKDADEPVFSIVDIQRVYPEAQSFEQQSDRSLAIYDGSNKRLGFVLISEQLDASYQGYAGAVPLLIAMDNANKIIATELLANNETAEFMDHVNDEKLLETWNALPMDTLLLSTEVDAVSGATKSSAAIIRTFEATAGNYLQTEHRSGSFSVIRAIQLILMAALLFLSLSMVLRKRFRKLYAYYLIGVVLVMGFWLKKMLSLELLNNWLTKDLPWQSNWELILILIIAITLSIAGHKKYYCTYLCPMGAMQMLVSKYSPFKKRKLQLRISTLTLRTVYLSFIWVALILGFSLPLAYLEPFMAFSYKVATQLMLGAGILIILLSLVFNRPWCQLCPTGCLLDSIPSLKSNRKK